MVAKLRLAIYFNFTIVGTYFFNKFMHNFVLGNQRYPILK